MHHFYEYATSLRLFPIDADEMRRYSTYTKNYGDNRLYRVACGPIDADYYWMETLMREGNPGRCFQGISLHYYTVAHNWSNKGSATDFDESDYFLTMSKTLFMDELLRTHINCDAEAKIITEFSSVNIKKSKAVIRKKRVAAFL